MQFRKSTYFSILFLLCFTVSFGAGTLRDLRTPVHKADPSHGKQLLFSDAELNAADGGSIFFEKNENENEKGFLLQAFLLPFYHACFRTGTFQCLSLAACPPQVSPHTPVYLSVRNFRI